MALSVNTNLSAMQAYLNLSKTSASMAGSMAKLSSGLRINVAADDAAGLSISEGLKSQVNGYGIAARNAQDGVNLIQTADGALGEAHSILQRMRDLAVQAGNDSNNAASRKAISDEVGNLVSELTRISKSTNFNQINLLDGSKPSLNFQVGADGTANSQIGVNLASANLGTIATALSVGNTSTGTTFAVASLAAVGGAQTFTVKDGNTTTDVTVTLGAAGTYATGTALADALNGNSEFSSKMVATVERDPDGATTGIKVQALSGTVVDAVVPGTGIAAGSPGTSSTGMDFSTASGAQAAIALIDTKIGDVSAVRSELGAAQNRLTHAMTIANVAAQNLSASASHITDTDMALEMVKYTKDSVLSQAGTAMLAQANASGQSILKLLG